MDRPIASRATYTFSGMLASLKREQKLKILELVLLRFGLPLYRDMLRRQCYPAVRRLTA
jgi:hypothetical protein